MCSLTQPSLYIHVYCTVYTLFLPDCSLLIYSDINRYSYTRHIGYAVLFGAISKIYYLLLPAREFRSSSQIHKSAEKRLCLVAAMISGFNLLYCTICDLLSRAPYKCICAHVFCDVCIARARNNALRCWLMN